MHRNLSFAATKLRVKGERKREGRISSVRKALSGIANNGARTRAEPRGFFLRMHVLIIRGGETSPTTHTNYANCRMRHYGAQCNVHQVHPFHRWNILLHPFARPRREGRNARKEKLEEQKEREGTSYYHRPGRRPRP